MYHIYADDGRILTSPKELEPLLKGAFPAFSNTVGHIRFFMSPMKSGMENPRSYSTRAANAWPLSRLKTVHLVYVSRRNASG